MTVKLALSSVLVAVAVVLSPLYFVWGPTKAYPAQHMVNSVAGVILGPLWAALIAAVVGTIRISLGTGTIFAYPGGIPGGIVVGLVYRLATRLIKKRRLAILAASLSEPLGTILVGGTFSWYILDPLLGGSMHAKFGAIVWFLSGWALSSVTGCVLGALCLLALDKTGLLNVLKG
ncbi:energy coupling factor transporter S component ThiW [Infirmifilum lucidum]|uniref:Energy coupling factor transporter S component ThiW n=1 Tax=Infirmifilum lucidum TaxID=2776706 RepID=A0A7L9FLR7_9CREN|nr:energy coupling factor transporter S component ThiW [Infirmifilum lucidum]